jgi:two-component system, LytTR family, response regulator
MNIINAMIVDDEKKAIVVLRKLLQEYCPEVNIIAEAGRVNDAISLIEIHNPQLIFLDIEMPGKSGFDLLEKISGRNFHVIFVTAHSEFALKAFRFSVTDYLLKPVGIDELKQAIEKVKLLINAYVPDASSVKKAEAPVIRTLRISSTEGVIFVYLEHIIRVEAAGAYSHIYLENNKHYMVSDHLKLLNEYLTPPVFMRIHRSHIINLQKIKEVISKNGLFAEMTDGSLIEVAKRNRADFLKKIHQKPEN